jgi:hypothetical protein
MVIAPAIPNQSAMRGRDVKNGRIRSARTKALLLDEGLSLEDADTTTLLIGFSDGRTKPRQLSSLPSGVTRLIGADCAVANVANKVRPSTLREFALSFFAGYCADSGLFTAGDGQAARNRNNISQPSRLTLRMT